MKYLVLTLLLLTGCTTVNLNLDCYDVMVDGQVVRKCEPRERPERFYREYGPRDR